ncbi:unnamed protein product [Soboliphyme baturini]|uniref:Uncharacterized protein n=1 Tax=Soboliphyme baturini TaxID=241478 RepID=A0A183IJA7_9BILA|nr:unnamed protein product [Soboliphyme baturini]
MVLLLDASHTTYEGTKWCLKYKYSSALETRAGTQMRIPQKMSEILFSMNNKEARTAYRDEDRTGGAGPGPGSDYRL